MVFSCYVVCHLMHNWTVEVSDVGLVSSFDLRLVCVDLRLKSELEDINLSLT